MSTGTGVNVSKAVVYGVYGKPTGLDVSKALAFGVFGKPTGANVSKALAYGIFVPVNTSPPIWPSSLTLPDGVLGATYSQSWDLSPAASPTTYTLASGSLPPGLSLSNVSNDVGSLSGTPTTLGTYTFSLTATNSYGTATKSFTMNINTTSSGGTNPIIISPIPGYVLVGAAYSATLSISGGTSPYSVAVTSGSLPTGITLSGLVISGTPSVIGTYPFDLTVTDTNRLTTTRSFQITVGVAGGNYGWVA